MFLSGRIVSLIGGAGFFVASFLTWFWGEGRGYRTTEMAWQGEESLFAVICLLLLLALLAVGWAWRDGWLALGILELLTAIACFGLTIFFILGNKEPVLVYGRRIPTGIGAGAWVGLVCSIVLIVGAILNLCSGGLDRAESVDDYDDGDLPPRRRRSDRDDWDDPPRRRPEPRPRRRPPRRRDPWG